MDAETGERTGTLRGAVPVAIAALVVPLVISAVTLLTRSELTPIRDGALMELQVRAIGHHAVNLGLYSRDGWSHPGPLVFYTLVLPYRIVGGTAGMLVGALTVNGVAIVGTVLVTRRLAGERAALTVALALAALGRALGPVLIRDPWVCFLTTLPFGLFLAVVWAMTERRRWALPVAVLLASWLAQTHVGFAPLTVPLVLGATVVLAVREWRDPDRAVRRRLAGAVAAAAGVSLVVWAPVAWDQAKGRGNLGVMVRWFRDPNGPVHTLTEGARVVLGAFAVPPDFVTGHRRVASFTGETLLRTQWHLPLLLVVVAVGVGVAWRRRDHATLWFAGVLTSTAGLAVVAVARTIGIMYEYRLLWTWTVAALATALAVWTFWAVLARRSSGADRIATVLVVAGVIALGVAQSVDSVRSHDYEAWNSPVTAKVLRQLDHRYHDARGVVVLRAPTPTSEWYLQGILLGLQKRGIAARVVGDGGGAYANQVVGRDDRVAATLDVFAREDLAKLGRRESRDPVAYAGPRRLPAEQRALVDTGRRARALQSDFAAGRIDERQLARALLALDAHPDAVAVVRGR